MAEIRVRSSIENGSVKVYFKRDFRGNLSDLPEKGSPIDPALILSNKDNWDRLIKGTVTDVQEHSSPPFIQMDFGNPQHVLREVFIEGEKSKAWKEVSEQG